MKVLFVLLLNMVEAPTLTPGFQQDLFCSIFSFLCKVLLTIVCLFFFCPSIYCMSCLLIIPLVFSNIPFHSISFYFWFKRKFLLTFPCKEINTNILMKDCNEIFNLQDVEFIFFLAFFSFIHTMAFVINLPDEIFNMNRV